MNKNLCIIINNMIDLNENLSMVIRELKFIRNNNPFRELIYDIEKELVSGSDYMLDSYIFNEDFEVEIRINKFLNDDLLIYVLVPNSWFYRDDAEIEYSHILSTRINKDSHLIFTIEKAVKFIKDLKHEYRYCKFSDNLMPIYRFDKNLKIRLQKNSLCHREINECIVCYEPTYSFLKCFHCKKHLCRVCEFKLKDNKCPHCRTKYIFDDEDNDEEY